uniref:Uncharacterized protein n=1 Tax=Fagus sylvatica TaxID=28930 RepID=A0A2N9I656_FAGSY
MPTPLATPRRREPPQPAAKPCRARSLPVWRSPTAKPAAWGCRARSLLVGHRNEFGWSPEFHFAKLSVTIYKLLDQLPTTTASHGHHKYNHTVKGGCSGGVWEVGMLANSFSTYERTVGQFKQIMDAVAVQMHNGLTSEDGSSSKCCSLSST